MLNPSIKDLQYRKVRFILAITGVALLFMMVLIMDGIASGMKTWTTQYISDLKVDGWVIQKDTEGPFTSYSVLPETVMGKAREIEGVKRADPLVMAMQNIMLDGESKRVYLIGHRSGSMVEAKKIKSGRRIAHPGEVVVDESLKISIGKKIKLAGNYFKVVGKSENTTYVFNSPIVFMSLADSQNILFNGQSMVNTLAITVEKSTGLAPVMKEIKDMKGVEGASQAKMLKTVAKQVDQPLQAITFFKNMFWFVGALIVAMIVYVTSVERIRDFAVFKAIGATNGYIARLVLIQAALVSLIAAAAAAGMAVALAPVFPLKLSIQQASLISTPLIALLVSIIGSYTAVRKATKVDPALAFGG